MNNERLELTNGLFVAAIQLHVTNEHSTNQSYSLKLSRWLWIEFPRASLDTDMTKSPGISRDFYNFPASDILPKHR